MAKKLLSLIIIKIIIIKKATYLNPEIKNITTVQPSAPPEYSIFSSYKWLQRQKLIVLEDVKKLTHIIQSNTKKINPETQKLPKNTKVVVLFVVYKSHNFFSR